MARFEVHALVAPSCWASYLVNADPSGLDETDRLACDTFMERNQHLGDVVDCDDAGFHWHHDAYLEMPLGADCQTYTFLKPKGVTDND